MRPTVGIICEYDPFHRGHARQFALVREKLPDARIVCVMSGCFTQRGSPALFSPAFRARAALEAGASLVLELPCAFALREAEHFALGSVAVLQGLTFVTHISFGCEDADPAFLQRAAAVLESEPPAYRAALRAGLCGGTPFVAAQARAVAAALALDGAGDLEPVALKELASGDAGVSETEALQAQASGGISDSETAALQAQATGGSHGAVDSEPAALLSLKRPNNILAICYLRALMRLGSDITPLPVRREGDYHATSLGATGYPSASAARRAYLVGDVTAAEAACGYPLTGEACHRPDALDSVLLHTLRGGTPENLRALPGCAEGLENRLARAAREATSRAELLALIKTKRYPHARLNRLLGHALLGVTGELLRDAPLPRAARLLGYRRDDLACLALLNESRLPIIAKAADGDRSDPLFALDERAYDLWALGAGLPAGLLFTQKVVTV